MTTRTVISKEQILIYYQRMAYGISGEVTKRDIDILWNTLLAEVTPRRIEKEGRTEEGYLATLNNLDEALSPILAKLKEINRLKKVRLEL